MCATSWKAQVSVWTPAHPPVCDQQQEPGRTVTDPLHLWDGQADPGEACRALHAQPGVGSLHTPALFGVLFTKNEPVPAQTGRQIIAYPWESPNALLRYVLLFFSFPIREQRQGVRQKCSLLLLHRVELSVWSGVALGVFYCTPKGSPQPRPPRLGGRAGIIPGCGAAAWWAHEYPGLYSHVQVSPQQLVQAGIGVAANTAVLKAQLP